MDAPRPTLHPLHYEGAKGEVRVWDEPLVTGLTWVGVGRAVAVAVAVTVGVGVGEIVAVAVAVGVGLTVAVTVAVAVGVAVGVASDMKGITTSTFTGNPVLKKPMVALPPSGGAVESNRKLYSVPQR